MSEKKQTLGQAIDQVVAALEGLDAQARKTALQAACSHLEIELGSSAPTIPFRSVPPPSATSQKPDTPTAGTITDIRSLKEQKQPSSARQMACVVAYYLQELAPETEKKETVSTEDLEKYFKQAGFKLPTKLEQVLADAKRSGYFESPARGEYRLNAVGYNLVVHTMPKRQE